MTADPISPMPNRAPWGSGLHKTRIMAVLGVGGGFLGGPRPELSRVTAVTETLVENGIRCLALTAGGADGLPDLERLAARLPAGVELGLGAAMTPDDVIRAAAAGAGFVRSPQVAPDVVHAARRCGLASYPGALTPTEIHLAWRTGATAVHLFPGSVQGPGYLAAVRRALPGIPLIPSGGIGCDDVAEWLAAGAAAVGLGRSLLGDALLPGGNLRLLGVRTRLVCAAAAGAHS
ncbi:2-dehydro-3-deoxyphosphogluconate aldolase/(4S)-4-hydroxy-2-oxoglutarate aldolase [Arthrobacter sp. UYP6]|uniref:bifunctional 4-hydroxy-2-oxoglutarate aldolase/2-dehydro-3-deoxy-phosphogluconate aldolase n=1 Tax=Arthrobacter sp. UYP6 TaxID=1756378 RepID=UPI0033981C6A